MPVPHHDPLELMAGDSWNVPFTLTDATGGPLDLTQASFEWVLIGQNGLPIQLNPSIRCD
jgi:hypothetical protein